MRLHYLFSRVQFAREIKIYLYPLIIFLGCFASFIPMCCLKPAVVDDVYNLPLREALTNQYYKYVLLIGFTMPIPLIADIFLSSKIEMNKKFSMVRLVFLTVLCLESAILFFVVCPSLYFELVPALKSASSIFIFGNSLHAIQLHGGHVWTPKSVHVIILCYEFVVITGIFQGYVYNLVLSIIKYIVVIISFLYFLLLCYRFQLHSMMLDDENAETYGCTLQIWFLIIYHICLYVTNFSFIQQLDWWSTKASYLIVVTALNILYCTLHFLIFGHISRQKNNLDKAQEKSEVKRDFIRFISHELRTPLNTITLGAKYQQKEGHNYEFSTEWREVSREVQESTEYSQALLNDLSTYEEIDAGLLQLNVGDVYVKEFIENIIQSYGHEANSNGIQLRLQFSQNRAIEWSSAKVLADRVKLTQVLRILLTNTIKYIRHSKRKEIHVSVDVMERIDISKKTRSISRRSGFSFASSSHGNNNVKYDLLIHIKDTGPGMSKANQEELLKNDFQFNPNMLMSGRWCGVGHYIVKQILDLHMGQIEIKSEGEDAGCTFKITLPLAILVDTFPSISRASSVSPIQVALNIVAGRRSHVVVPVKRPSVIHIKCSVESLKARRSSSNQSSHLKDSIKLLRSSSNIKLGMNVGTSKTGLDNQEDGDIEKDEYGDLTVDNNVENNAVVSLDVFSTRVILLVDDARSNRRLLSLMLRDRCLEIIEAQDGITAVEIIKNRFGTARCPDLILMDFQMPRMNGPAATKVIRELGFTGLIIGVTGNATPKDQALFLDNGANRVFSKPLDFSLFEASMEEYYKALESDD